MNEQLFNTECKKYDPELDPKSFFIKWRTAVETQLKKGTEFHTYTPSIWTLTFMEGINTVELPSNSKPRVMEIGVGTGIATAFMAKKWPNAEIFGVDIEEQAIKLAKRNVSEISGKRALKRCHFFASDILLPFKIREPHEPIDAIFGNLPLKETNHLTKNELRKGNMISAFYSVPDYIKHLNEFASNPKLSIEKKKAYQQILDQDEQNPHLLLHRILFSEAREVLAPDGSLVITCSASCKSPMERLLDEYGFHGEVSAINYEYEDEEGTYTHQSDLIYAISASFKKL